MSALEYMCNINNSKDETSSVFQEDDANCSDRKYLYRRVVVEKEENETLENSIERKIKALQKQ